MRITRNGQTAEIIICENGQFSEGWEPLSLPPNPKAGELYFGFQSATKYATSPDDQLEIELHVAKDLDGIGADQTGILPAGIYKAKGTYSGLLDEYKAPASLTKELADKMRKMYEFKAFLENWREQWDLRITSDEGWMPSKGREEYDKMMEKLKKEDAATNR